MEPDSIFKCQHSCAARDLWVFCESDWDVSDDSRMMSVFLIAFIKLMRYVIGNHIHNTLKCVIWLQVSISKHQSHRHIIDIHIHMLYKHEYYVIVILGNNYFHRPSHLRCTLSSQTMLIYQLLSIGYTMLQRYLQIQHMQNVYTEQNITLVCRRWLHCIL